MKHPLITESLSINFGGLQAVWDVSYHAEEGVLQAIIGPNGAGKTTFFNLLCGALPANRGSVILFGQDVTQMSWQRRAYLGLGRTFQTTNIFAKQTVLDNILLAAQSQKNIKYIFFRRAKVYQAIYSRAMEVMEEWGFWDKRDIPAENLSYGEQRQLDIMLALVEQPRLLLLDEPTAGLSQAETDDVCKIIQKLSRDRTILLIEHDMDVVFKLAERVTVLHQGRILTEGSPDEIKTDTRVKEIYLGEEEME